MRFRIDLSYYGPAFRGWQSQSGGGTAQDAVEQALAVVCKFPVRCHGAGRTDAGVHALCQTAHFDVPETMALAPCVWMAALNANLPPTLRILRCRRVAESFHARFSATGKHYRYLLSCSPVLSPFDSGRMAHLPDGVDESALGRTLELFVGTHDFASFCARRRKPAASTIRTVFQVRLAPLRSAGGCRIDFIGDGFLYKMARMLAGAALRVARGKAGREEIVRLLAEPDPGSARHVAPAEGLYLVRAIYRRQPSPHAQGPPSPTPAPVASNCGSAGEAGLIRRPPGSGRL